MIDKRAVRSLLELESGSPMEMDINKLDVNSLPSGERKFIDLIIGSNFGAYGVGYVAEQATLAQLGNHFRHLNEFANVGLLRVGSGGRFEGAALGDTEFVLLTKDSMGDGWQPPSENEAGSKTYPSAYFNVLVETTGTDIVGVGLTPYMNVVLEHKRLDGADPLSYYAGNRTPFPGRILEGEYVAGSNSLVTEARRKVFGEIIADRRIIAGMKKDLKVHKKVCQTGLSRGTPQFKLDTGEFYFDPPNRQFGMKYGLLRYVQTALSIQLFELFQRKQLPIEEYLDLNQGVEERIRYAFRKGWVANEEELIIAGHIYLQLTEMNSTAKVNYYTDNTRTKFWVDPESLRVVTRDVIDIFQQQLLID